MVLKNRAGHDEQRSLLKDGQACPLCGSVDHPYVHGGLPATAISLLEERVRVLESRGRELQDSRSAAEAAQAVAGANAGGAEHAATESVAKAGQAQEDYRSRVASLALDLPASAAEASAAITSKIQATQTNYSRAENDEQHALHLAADRDQAREGLDRARANRNAAVDTHAGHTKQEQELATTIARLVEDRARLAKDLDDIETLLAPVMTWQSDWVVAARRDPGAFLATCQDRVQQFEVRQRGLDAVTGRVSQLRANLETGRALLGERQANLESSASALQTQEEVLSALQAQRAELIQGRSVSEVEAELRRMIEDATASHETTRKAHAEASTSIALAQAAQEAAVKGLHEADQDAAYAERALAVAMAEIDVDRQKLEERLAHDETWIAQQRKHLDALRELVTRDEATRDERLRSLDDHSANGRPESDRDVAQARATDARAQVEDLGQKLIGLSTTWSLFCPLGSDVIS